MQNISHANPQQSNLCLTNNPTRESPNIEAVTAAEFSSNFKIVRASPISEAVLESSSNSDNTTKIHNLQQFSDPSESSLGKRKASDMDKSVMNTVSSTNKDLSHNYQTGEVEIYNRLKKNKRYCDTYKPIELAYIDKDHHEDNTYS